jgi:hypothetical protein
MSSQRIQTLMERLRIQSIIQRLVRSLGREAALEVVSEAIRLEFPEDKTKDITVNQL